MFLMLITIIISVSNVVCLNKNYEKILNGFSFHYLEILVNTKEIERKKGFSLSFSGKFL